MKTKLLVCAALAAGSIGLASCSSSGSSTASGSSSTAGSSSGGSSSGGASSGGASSGGSSSAASTRKLCEEVTAAEVSTLTGQTITSAAELSAGSRFRSGFTGPSCLYKTSSGLGGVSAEFVSADTYQGLVADPGLKPTPLAGVGDEAYQVTDQIDPSKVIRTIAKKGDQYVLVLIYSGTSADNAKTLTTELLG